MSVLDTAIDLTDIPEENWKDYIGNGYRNCCYLTDHERKGQIILFGYDTFDNPQTFILPHKSWIKYRVKYQTPEKDIYGNYVDTKYFDSSYSRKKYLENSNGLFVVEALRPEVECLQKLFRHAYLDADFNKQSVRTFYLDIETEISETFMKPVDALNRINMITIYDTLTSKFYTWSLGYAKVKFEEESLKSMDPKNFEIFTFQDNEIHMLEHFIHWWETNYPDVVTGYNSVSYDMPYIVRRIENVLGKSDVQRLSPIGKYRIKEVNHDNERANVQADIEIDISGIFSADELILYRDKFHVKAALDGGYNLNNVGEAEGLGRKIEYSGSLKDLYLTDYQRFYEYNVRDVDLLKRIEEKCKLIPLARQITSLGLSNIDTIYTSISYLVGSLIAFAKSEMNVVFNSYIAEKKEKVPYEGAYVFPPIPGLYKGGIATIDVNSLYPSTIRSLNLSPETYVGKLLEDWDDTSITEYHLKPANSEKIKLVKREEIEKLINEQCIITKNNTLLLKHKIKRGVITEWCTHFYALRKSTKKKMQKLEMAIYNKEISDDKLFETETKIENLNNAQLGYKTMLNSVYGILGTNHSAIFQPDLAQTITRNGKFFNKSASKHTFDFFKKYFKVDDNYITTIAGDTDSNFLNIKCVTDYFKKKFNLPENINAWSDEYKLKLWKFMDNYVEKDLNPYMQQLIANECKSDETEMLAYSMEYIGDVGIYEAKKHYGVHKIVSEGPELVDKVKYCGIELKKATVPVAIKSFLKDIYENTLKNNWTNDEFKAYINQCYEKFLALDITDIAIWKGWSSDKIETTGFLEEAKGMTGISKAAHHFNDLLLKLNLSKKYDSCKVGDKLQFAYILKNNQYRIEALAWPVGNWPKEFDEIFSVDYQVMFQKLILQPLKGYFEATKFQNIDPRQQMAFDINDL